MVSSQVPSGVPLTVTCACTLLCPESSSLSPLLGWLLLTFKVRPVIISSKSAFLPSTWAHLPRFLHDCNFLYLSPEFVTLWIYLQPYLMYLLVTMRRHCISLPCCIPSNNSVLCMYEVFIIWEIKDSQISILGRAVGKKKKKEKKKDPRGQTNSAFPGRGVMSLHSISLYTPVALCLIPPWFWPLLTSSSPEPSGCWQTPLFPQLTSPHLAVSSNSLNPSSSLPAHFLQSFSVRPKCFFGKLLQPTHLWDLSQRKYFKQRKTSIFMNEDW